MLQRLALKYRMANRKHLMAERVLTPTSIFWQPGNPGNMTPKTNLKLVSRILVRWLFGLSLTMGTLFAQSTGTITGRVFDQATGRSLQGAVVHIKGSTASDFTDTEGRFTLSGVPRGCRYR